MTPEGAVHTWPESGGTHQDVAEAKDIPWKDVRRSAFLIRPSGEVVFPYTGKGYPKEAGWIKRVRTADPRLKPIPSSVRSRRH